MTDNYWNSNSSRSERLAFRLIILLSGLLLITLIGCSDRKATSDLSATHTTGWSIPESEDFHGRVAVECGVVATCARCHGVDLDGGEVEVSCVDCHLASGACTSCHGGQDNQTGAPPMGLHGETSTDSLAVGAHTAHLTGNDKAAAVVCSNCHLVPSMLTDSSHFDVEFCSDTGAFIIDSIAEISWQGLADSGNSAEWVRDSAQCRNVYCHGNFAGGNSDNVPRWTDLTAVCGSCHDVGADPALLGWKHEFHVGTVGLLCADCHSRVIDDQLSFITPTLHINGVADTSNADYSRCDNCHGAGSGSCVTCHGGTDNLTGAPPVDLGGDTATTSLGVGAHTTHLDGKTYSTGFSCSTCHKVPLAVADSTHLGLDSIAELTWSALAGPNARWDRPSSSCASTYCHGDFSGGSQVNRPRWNQSGQAECGSCHDAGQNPEQLGWKHAYHVDQANLSCGECHANVIDTLLNFVALDRHVDGLVDTLVRDTTVCNSCHGAGANSCILCHGGQDNNTGAPPSGLFNVTSTDSIGVGAHTAHVEGKNISDGIDCSTCHLVPASESDPGHRETPADNMAEVIWSGLAGGLASWDRNNATCSETYCHGNFAAGNSLNAPIWTSPNQADCGTCHDIGADPVTLGWHHDTHVGTFAINCYACHGSVVDSNLTIIGKDLHINGQADSFIPDQGLCGICHDNAQYGCVGCHGGKDNTTGAPPYSLVGDSLTSDLAVGAHTAHLEGKVISDGILCDECHLNPTNFTDSGHYAVDSIAELRWGSLAGANGNWNRGAATCTDTYCHGDFRGGNALNVPIWNQNSQAGCGSCHDVGDTPANLRDKHDKHVRDKNVECYECHNATTNAALEIIGPSVHIDGLNQVEFSSGQGVYANGECTNVGCHGKKSW